MRGRTGPEPIDISPGIDRCGTGADINPVRRGSFAGLRRAAGFIVGVIVASGRASGITRSRGLRRPIGQTGRHAGRDCA